MRNVVVLFIIGLLSFPCKSETPKDEKIQAVVSVYKVYNSLELMEKVNTVIAENDSVGQLIVTDLAKANGYLPVIETKDTAIVKDYVAKLNFDKPITCAFVSINNPVEKDIYSLIVHEQAPLISETVTLSISPRENQEYEGLFKFADAEKWERITQDNIGRQLALAVNGVIKSAPTVITPIEGGSCSVVGPDLDKLLK